MFMFEKRYPKVTGAVMEDKFEKVELTSMCMISDGNGNILVQDRVKSWCGIAFPGGHVEKYESIVDSVVREVKEVTGLTISHPRLCGIKQWFSENTRSVCFLFATETFEGELVSSDEGENFWIRREDIGNYRLAPMFELMLEELENPDISEYYHRRTETGDVDILK